MLAEMQFKMTSTDLEVVLAVVRAKTLVEAGKRLGVDGSTVFRSVQRLEKGLGQRLFERSRSGSQPTELALQLVQHAERIEFELEAARTAMQKDRDGLVTGSVRIAMTDTILRGLVLPVLGDLAIAQPLLQFELTTSNEFASLAKRDTDIALRVTRQPHDHLVGKLIGRMRMALFGPRTHNMPNFDLSNLSRCAWIAPDDALPAHSTVQWRKRHYPQVTPRYKVNSILSVVDAIASGLGIGLIPLFLAQHRSDLVQLSEPLDECETQLWLLTHTESRHITRVSTTYTYLANHLVLE
ncbi:LysR family transcriptional regulator [Dyella tabacisoli]|uniref:LysR family transcriptional regulator n=1 Tax=Dyella tabacisoli TaxID=2282381 RepID=A0A369UT72_9GAMM|nr:LysR family transcriptional regulator [Dyella tabacisoli]RDD83711.1 LysR family transcriptional regulator [Dyella tabacisoli]